MLTVLILHCWLQVCIDRCLSSGLIRQENNFVGPMSGVVFNLEIYSSWQSRVSLQVTVPILILQGFREHPLWPITASLTSLHVCEPFFLAGTLIIVFWMIKEGQPTGCIACRGSSSQCETGMRPHAESMSGNAPDLTVVTSTRH
jgi:hypothetical protein